MLNLNKKRVVITGASSGIGRQCAIMCSRMGASLILFGRNKEQLELTHSQLTGEDHLSFAQDISNIAQFGKSIETIVSEYGALDGFIHSAGIQSMLPLRLHNNEVYSNLFEINAIGGFECCRILIQKNFFNNGGSIILIASIRGIAGAPAQVGYAASKGAVIAGARSLAVELAFRNIRVNSISPGMVEDTEMTRKSIEKLPIDWVEKSKSEYPLGWITAEDVANTCGFLLSDLSKKITGTNIVIDGGFSAK